MTLERARQISKVRNRRCVLHRAEFFVSRSQLALQSAIAACVLRETVEIVQPALHDQRAGRGGAWQIHDCVVYFKNERIRQLSYFVETSLGARSLRTRDSRLPRRRDNANQERDRDQSRGANSDFLPPNKLTRAV